MKEYESDISYIVEWLESHKRISRIYALDGNVILFTHKFFNKKRIIGNYVLIYYKDEKAAQDSFYALRNDYYKIKNNYYCYTTFYE